MEKFRAVTEKQLPVATNASVQTPKRNPEMHREGSGLFAVKNRIYSFLVNC